MTSCLQPFFSNYRTTTVLIVRATVLLSLNRQLLQSLIELLLIIINQNLKGDFCEQSKENEGRPLHCDDLCICYDFTHRGALQTTMGVSEHTELTSDLLRLCSPCAASSSFSLMTSNRPFCSSCSLGSVKATCL